MQVITGIAELKTALGRVREEKKTIGFVPTMGYLHEGHLSLLRAAREKADFVVVSIFVNPIQFAPNEDFARYPRDFERDCSLIAAEGGDLVFHPAPEEMYPPDFVTQVSVANLGNHLCGRSRPHHFAGVTTVLSKLFHLIGPDWAFFGEKDAQQLFIVKQMVKDLCMPLEIIGCPIVREADGLAKSSRNIFLSPEERREAVVLHQALSEAKADVAAGNRDAAAIIAAVKERIAATAGRIDYVEAVALPQLEPIKVLRGDVLLALAVYFGKTRLIDNIIITV